VPIRVEETRDVVGEECFATIRNYIQRRINSRVSINGGKYVGKSGLILSKQIGSTIKVQLDDVSERFWIVRLIAR
jgi:hypothetical protein